VSRTLNEEEAEDAGEHEKGKCGLTLRIFVLL